MTTLLQDISFGFRLLTRTPGLTVVAILSIALGIGANALVFNWVDATLLHPLPGVARQEEIAAVKSLTPEGNSIDSSWPDYRDFRDQSTLFAGFLAAKQRPFNLGEPASADRVWAETVSGNYFDVLGVKPILGRTFNASEQGEERGAHPVAVLSERMWRRKFQSDSGIIGRTILINNHPLTVIGVVPAAFRGVMNGLSYDLWIPMTMRPELAGEGDWLADRGARPLQMFARRKPGVTFAQAQAELDSINRRLREQYPATNADVGVRAYSLFDSPDGASNLLRTMMEVLMGAGAVVLLIVCANVANILLARATARQKEFAIRIGLGAGRVRLLRQLLTESALLALGGAVAGLLLAAWLSGSLDRFIPPTDLPVGLAPQVNLSVIGWTAALAALTTVLCGIAPSLHAMRADVNGALKAGARGTSSSGHANRLRGLLVMGEVALAVVALAGAGLLIKSFRNAQNANPGFDSSHILLAGLDLSTNNRTREQNLDILRRARHALETLPGASGVTFSEDVPLGLGGRSWETVRVEGYVPREGENMKVWRNLVAPGYFSVLGIPLLEGRDFSDLDTRDTQRVIVVNQTFARRYFGNAYPIGRKVDTGGRLHTVIGVVRDCKYISLDEPPTPYFYLPLEQAYHQSMGLAVHLRTAGNPVDLGPALRTRLMAIEPNMNVTVVIPMSGFVAGGWFAHRVGASLLAVLGGIALLLAAIGLYGVMSYSIGQRTQEIGIRMALGASPAAVRGAVLGSGMALAAGGIGAGLVLCVISGRFAGRVLYQVSGTDPGTFAAVAAFLFVVAALAALVPARRATRIDPVKALNQE